MKLLIRDANQPSTLSKIDSFEKEFNVKLSQGYKNFLLENDGGYAISSMYYKNDTSMWDELNIGNFLSLEEISQSLRYMNQQLALNKFEEWEPEYQCIKKGTLIIALESVSEISLGFQEHNFDKVYISAYVEGSEMEIISESFNEFINGFEYR